MDNCIQNPWDVLISKIFGRMVFGLLITAGTALLLYSSGIYYATLTAYSFVAWVCLLAQIILTFVLSDSLTDATSASFMHVTFIIYSVLMGFSMAGLGYVYDLDQIAAALGIGVVYFLCLAFIARSSKINLCKVGSICCVSLFVMLVSQLLMFFFSIDMNIRLWSIGGLLMFTGITAWDIQKIDDFAGAYDPEKLSIYFALQLYLDFINIFLRILELFGSKDD